MTYKEFIDDILQTRGRFVNSNKYHERHHIIPRCKNGTDDEENLIDLFAREHFIAHKLLAEENPDDNQLVCAYTLMAFVKDKNQQRYELTPEEYDDARKTYARRFSGNKNPASKQVIRLCDDKIYNTVRECYIDNNISNTTIYVMLKEHRKFVYYNEWVNMTENERKNLKSIDWDFIQHINRSDAAKKAGNGGSVSCSQSTRKKISIAHKGKCGVKVYCPELDETFLTIKEAQDKYGVCKTSIGNCIAGKQKYAGKHPITGEKLTWVRLENKNC